VPILKRLKVLSLFLLALASCFFLVKEVYFHLTDGFSLANITFQENGLDSFWQPRLLSQEESSEVKDALEQEYFYLSKGHQAYVFESRDKRYVIKFLKFQKYRPHWLYNIVPLPAFLENILLNKMPAKNQKVQNLVNSWKIAFDELPKETGVLYVQLGQDHDNPKRFLLRNKSGYIYEIDLNEYVFMVQRKVDVFDIALHSLMSQGNTQRAKELLDNLLALYLAEYNKGIYEKDRYIVRNTGVFNNFPIQIDTGRLRKDDFIKELSQQKKELVWKTSLLSEWLEQNYPELNKHLHERLIELQGLS